MPEITLDVASVELLRRLKDVSEVIDAHGYPMGRFVPVTLPTEPKITESEARRRLKEEHGKGYRLSEILADLEKRG